MYLQRIELQGFKSFANRSVIEFPAPGKGCQIAPNVQPKGGRELPRGICGVTAIVGPNGSGKSNIVDAVRWVLGEQSLKLLRGKKSTDVIFSGSSHKNQMGLAEVSLHLNNEDRSAPIDYTEVVITRKIYRDGSSDYLLNKNQVRLFDIVMLLAKANFGQNTYSVIGQGMVDKIVNYSAQDRKEFFDEATGVKQYQIKRDKSVNKLKRSRDNLGQAKTLLQELEPHLKSLTRQVNRLHKRQTVETELKELQIKYYGKHWLDLDSHYQTLALSFNETDKQRMRLEQAIEGLQQVIDELSQERGRTEEFNKLQSDYDSLIANRNTLMRQLAEVKGKLDVEYLKIGKQDLSWLENRQEELTRQIKDLQNQLTDLDKQIKRQTDLRDDKLKQQAQVVQEFNQLEDKLLSLQKEFRSDLGVSEKEIRQVVNRIYSLQKDFITKLKTTHDLESLAKLKAEAEVVYAEVEAFYAQISQQDKQQQSAEMSDLQNQLSDFIKNKDSLVNEINEVKIKLEVMLSQHKSFTAKLAELQHELDKAVSDLKKNQLKDQVQIDKNLRAEKESLIKEIEDVEVRINEIKSELNDFNQAEEEKRKQIFTTQQDMHAQQVELNRVVSQLNDIKINLAKIETKKEDLFDSMRTDLGQDYRPSINKEFVEIDLEETEVKIIKLKKQLELIGGTDPEVEAEYHQVKERHDYLFQQVEDLEKAIKDLEKVVLELDKLIKKQFEQEFKKINRDFTRYFKKLFTGGSAKLVLSQKEQTEAEAIREELADAKAEAETEEEGEPMSEEKKAKHVEDKSYLANMGIDIEACPPGKKIKNVNMLSGGEKTMTALALICAIISNNPSPFILFDEVDAALDEANSAKFSDIVEELSHKTQFIVITHNRAIMSRADVLYGVTMQGDGISRLISLKLEQANELAKK